MSDLLTAVSASLNTPEDLIQRSAAARAAANGTTIDDVLSAWSGGAPMAAAPAPVPAPDPDTSSMPEREPESEPVIAAVATMEPPVPELEPYEYEPVEEPIEPIPLRRRVRTATRVGTWTGGALGLIGFLVASSRWALDATVTGTDPYTPVISADSNGVIIGVALVSIVFGVVVAAFSRAAAGWVSPGMRLSNSPGSSAWLGAFLGLVLGLIAGAMLTSAFGTPVEGTEGLIQMPVLATLAVMIIGGAVLGGGTAAITQAVGVPVATEESPDHIVEVKGRLARAFTVPLTAIVLLLLFVLPFAWALLQSNDLTAGGAAIVGILTAAGILTFASLAGSRPNIRLSFGEVMVAAVGVGTVILVILLVLSAQAPA